MMDKDDNNNLLSWVPVAIGLLVFWPVGLGMLISKLKKQEKTRKQEQEPAYRKYASERKNMVAGQPKHKVNGGRFPKVSDSGLNLVTVLGFVLLFAGAALLSDNLSYILYVGIGDALRYDALNTLMPLFFATGGISCFFALRRMKKELKRFRKYQYTIGRRKAILIRTLAEMAGVSIDQCCDDLQEMIEKGYLGDQAYIDLASGNLFLELDAQPEVDSQVQPEEPKKAEDEYADLLNQIRTANDRINDLEVSAKIAQIELLTTRIFGLVREEPQKLPRLRTFMNYYLPTTLKLLNSYAHFEKQGIEGENISAAKEKIEAILDTLVETFRRQLDALFTNDAMDVASDIEVLEQMMTRDGFSGEEDGSGLIL
ncbi:MAG: 5-bromo-4-chloroindolyl phosphate hydrolysis family protein [Clostridia bacterium]|nr:5-bromo-4-chloroindolyl phosphate hydrolysis family protein [Clostridia bacterium]